jgi:polyferredoxin
MPTSEWGNLKKYTHKFKKKQTMNIIQKIGIGLVCAALAIFTLSLGLSQYQLRADNLPISNEYHAKAIMAAAQANGTLDKTYNSNISFIAAVKKTLKTAQADLSSQTIPNGVGEWDVKIGNWKIKDYTFDMVRATSSGLVPENKGLFLFLTFGLAILGGLLYILPIFQQVPGIKNNLIYFNPMTRGLKLNVRSFFLIATIVGVIVYGYFYANGDFFFPVLTTTVVGLIIFLVLRYENQQQRQPARSASPQLTGWLGILTGVYLIGFYILLYWSPAYLMNWILMVDPVSQFLSGNIASRWFLYGLMYTVIVIVMGTRMMAKYRYNNYQVVRTASVMFFQTSFAFLIPEILIRLNQPYFDFKNIWPLDYTFFFDYRLNELAQNGTLGIFMLVWGIVLTVIGVPLFTYFFGKRWYCSWVCGCGGLAETLGDPYRQLSDKSVTAWKYERWIIHGVLVAAIVMTAMVLYTYFSGQYNIFFLSSDSVRSWYGFLIGSAFAGVVGTGFYPLMGNRTWCRFGCPLAAYLGLVQRFQSRFRITTNGGQCISCGNCSTYCEMGIDVRSYAQRGQDIVRASCVGCGICAAVCPRGVLRLENATEDIKERTTHLRTIHITEDQIGLLY